MARFPLPTGKIIAAWSSAREGCVELPPQDEAAFLHQLADADVTCVAKAYFAGADVGPIKIGHTVDLKGRIAALRCETKTNVRLLATALGGRLREAAYHLQFEQDRERGEWFSRSPAILAEIKNLT